LALGEVIGTDRELSLRRQSVIDANPELMERELIKLARVADALAAGLRRRGVPAAKATLAAETGMAVFRVAFEQWLAGATVDWTAASPSHCSDCAASRPRKSANQALTSPRT
jgi:hypothetical protein